MISHWRRWRHYSQWLLGLIVCVGVVLLNLGGYSPQGSASVAMETAVKQGGGGLAVRLSQGQALYELGQLSEASQILETVLQAARSQPDPLHEAIALSNLALVKGQMGDWEAANRAIAQALTGEFATSLTSEAPEAARQNPDQVSILAQILNVQGRLQLGQGQGEQAFKTWQRAAALYQQVGDRSGAIRSQLQQARALQSLGFHRLAITDVLAPLETALANDADSLEKALGLRSLGEAYQVAENLATARGVSEKSLAVAERINSPAAIAAAALRLGNFETAQAQDDRSRQQTEAAEAATDKAFAFYQTVIDMPTLETEGTVSNRLRAQLNQLSLLVDAERIQRADRLWPVVVQQLESIAPHRDSVYARVNLADSLMRLARLPDAAASPSPPLPLSPSPLPPSPLPTAQHLLEIAQTDAETLGDNRAQAHVLGYLGRLYQELAEGQQAEAYTAQAVFLAQRVNATDLRYRWSAQLGDVLEKRGDKAGAIAAYDSAVSALTQLRSDLVNISPEIQFSFQKSVDPIHRKLIDLLLDPRAGNPSQQNLVKARDAIESLRAAELVNFLRAACLDAEESELTYAVEGTETTAFIHTLILADRLELIVKLPGDQALHNYTTTIPKTDLDTLAKSLRQRISTSYYSNSPTFQAPAKELYNILFAASPKQGQTSLAQDLATHNTDILAFVLDGSLRNLPINTLYDAAKKEFVLNQYQVVITPGFQLLNAHPRQDQGFNALTFGLTEARQGFAALPNVKQEVDELCTSVDCDTQFNQAFTRDQFLQEAGQGSAPIVHLATHGQFGSKLEQTFVLTWDDTLSVSDFNQWLRTDTRSLEATELLVLSACETAVGDDRTTLGLAGVAVRAGTRSTLASLWKVDDRMTALMMPRFYEALAQPNTTKAAALQTAQRYILDQYPEYKHPFYWSAFILVGSWL
ncbi:MAG: CHAT domain-containing protein [Cyanobacteria bacterium P01_A01_bin.114]